MYIVLWYRLELAIARDKEADELQGSENVTRSCIRYYGQRERDAYAIHHGIYYCSYESRRSSAILATATEW